MVADQIAQAVQSTSNLLHLMLQSSPSQGQLMKLPKSLLAKTSTIKNTETLLQQMPRVISELDAHMDNSLQSVSHLKTVIQLLENIESCQLKSLQTFQPPKEWKCRLNSYIRGHVERHGNEVPCPPDKTMPLQEEWQKCLDFFNSEELQARSQVNNNNRSQGNQRGTHGRKPVYCHRLDGLPHDATSIGENVVERDAIDSWADTQRYKDGMWVTEEAEANHRLLEHHRTQIAPGERRMLTREEEEQIFTRVFGSRRDRFTGRGPHLAKSRASQTSNASSSTATSSSRDVEMERMKKKLMIQTTFMDFLLKDYNQRNQTNLSFPLDDDDQGDNDDDNDLGSQP